MKKNLNKMVNLAAFEITAYNKAPMITSVTVTVEKGKVVSYFIDARQGTAVHSVDADNVENGRIQHGMKKLKKN
ncbi:MAG: hypothetical protein ACOX5X_04250 [Acholeplasmataceae bacterium]